MRKVEVVLAQSRRRADSRGGFVDDDAVVQAGRRAIIVIGRIQDAADQGLHGRDLHAVFLSGIFLSSLATLKVAENLSSPSSSVLSSACSACSPSALRSTRNRMRRNRLCLSSRYISATHVRVLPVPVAMATRMSRRPSASASSIASTASR